jgi:hypothetical protein
MFTVGDIVWIISPTAGKGKYHLCISAQNEDKVSKYIFLNSNPGFQHTYVVDCARIPCIPASETGKTAFSFTMLPQYTEKQLSLYKAVKKGTLESALADELLEFSKTVPVLSGADRRIVVSGLELIRSLMPAR